MIDQWTLEAIAEVSFALVMLASAFVISLIGLNLLLDLKKEYFSETKKRKYSRHN